ncbi:F-actin capping protein alpha subunit [Xylona heveae TC161]|uniref:F-actin-capping protein subunit alpha n=1 Tax=Xylona heveae (strain CBS 132557 / TC161) TaxID=1328760 RepID=A0A165FLZ8_XYLHT|nr:F-actin capping protein alpha subunit [Xylona heveae TC161]KZF21137.1 F-actin capping protein alpha subunit [Xylona heveae TC161]
MSSSQGTIASFIKDAPPGELSNVVTDIKALIGDQSDTTQTLDPACQQYNEEQLAAVKLPGSSQDVIISPYNSLGNGRYFDVESQTSFLVDHSTKKSSAVESYVLESQHADLVKSTLKALAAHAQEHYPSSSYGAYPTNSDSAIAVVLVANKYSPNNFWNGRWRSIYTFTPGSGELEGNIKVDVHYYEDGNVRLLTDRPITSSISSSATGPEVIRQIASLEKKYQEELNRAFSNLSEGAFKSLRRQLPITRQKIEWEKISGYRLGQDIGGGRPR